MKRIAVVLAGLSLSAAVLAADTAPADEGLAAVQALGRVNGLALACQQPALSSRARNAVITGAPKTRGYGEAFEAATSATFLEQGKGGSCPDAATLNQQLVAAEARLKAAFPAAQ